jgi:lactate racemase
VLANIHLTVDPARVAGQGGPRADLTAGELRETLRQALSPIPHGCSVLAIIADQTRDDNTHILFPLASEILSEKALRKFNALVAQGTHAPMTEGAKRKKVGADLGPLVGFGHVFDHDWADPSKLTLIGQLDSRQVKEITKGLLDRPIDLKVNALLSPGVYDTILVFGTTMPHEVAGFSGGAKYFFPGVAGPELTHATHWLGALASIEKIIGRVETPTRHLFEAAADLIPARVISLNSVVTRQDGRLRTHALFCGDMRATVRQAADVSKLVHIKYTSRKYKRVLALLEPHLSDLWVGGKASYRLGPVIEEGGELIIYAPHLKTISDVHGELIKRHGYAPLEIIRELVKESEELQTNLCVAAHLAHVSFASRLSREGKVLPRYSISLCSGIDKLTCRQVKLGYMDPSSFDKDAYTSDPDTLLVDQAGRDLYLVEPINE